MFKKKLGNKTDRDITEHSEEELSKPELAMLLQDLQKEVNHLKEVITTRLSTDITDQNKLALDYLNTPEKTASLRERSCRVQNKVEDCCDREDDSECLSAAGSSTTFWSTESCLILENVAMATECGHLFCESCIKDICFCAGAEALCPRCGDKVGILRKIYF